VAGRAVPEKLQALEEETARCFPDDATDRAMGSDVASLAQSFRERVYQV
jgi:hypothetical protein